MTDRSAAPGPAEIAEYVADMAGQLSSMARAAGFVQTAALLMRAELSALADLRALQPGKAAPDDAA